MMDTEIGRDLFKDLQEEAPRASSATRTSSERTGRVLGDIIDNKIGNVTKLTKIFRQKEASPVIAAANACLVGENLVNEVGVEFYEATNEQVQDRRPQVRRPVDPEGAPRPEDADGHLPD